MEVLTFSCSLRTYVCRPQGHKITNAPLITMFGTCFFIRPKHVIGHFLGFFMEISTFFLSKLSLVYVLPATKITSRTSIIAGALTVNNGAYEIFHFV